MGDAGGDSVLERLAGSSGEIPRVRLVVEGEAPPELAAGQPTRGRYPIAGEVGQGGVGVVYRGFDTDLGRPVAVKVLREEYGDDPDVVRRFVEEAQIGGQLQHPGIVPVYELGADRERRPFFTMKLVKGRTLADLLADRPDPRQDRRRFLAIFEAICQTIAYAHAHGVIHRDLKPSNVMVGAFGEVLVMDWGMGKVLDPRDARPQETRPAPPRTLIATVRTRGTGSRSEQGTLLGTPQYMPIEQALGEIDRVDARSDVFALGAVLCEILTGAPPYSGSTSVALSQAQRADLAPARARLAACGADAQLVALAESCLAPEQGARPADAAAVASAVSTYLSSIEEKARRAEVEAAEAKVKAAEERKARRLTVALALAAVGLLALGGGGWWWTETARRDRAERIDHAVAADLEEADALRLRAASGADGGLDLLRDALSSARRAEQLAQSPDGSAAGRTRATTLRAALEADLDEAGRRRDARLRDVAMVRRLEEIRSGRAEVWSSLLTSQAYAKAFEDYLGKSVEELGAEETARRIAKSQVRDDVILGLEDWIAMEDFGARPPGILPDVVRRLDPQSWGERLRAAGSDVEKLRALAADPAWTSAPTAHRIYLADRLGHAGDPTAAAEFAQKVWASHPSDFWANWGSAFWLSRTKPPRLQESIRFYVAAAALRPESGPTRNNLGTVLFALGDFRGAEQAYRDALRLWPDQADSRINLGNVLLELGDARGALASYEEAVKREPGRAGAHQGIGNSLVHLGEYLRGVAELREAARLAPDEASVHGGLGVGLREAGALDEAVAELETAIRLLPTYAAAHADLGIALVDKREFEKARTHLEEALRLDPKRSEAHNGMGHLARELGDLKQAAEAYRKAIALVPHSAEYHTNLANALRRLRDYDGAAAELRRAMELAPQYVRAHTSLGNLRYEMGDIAGAEAAHREAVRLSPTDAMAHINLGVVLIRRDLDAAVLELREGVRLRPDIPGGYGNLGSALAQKGDYEGALAALTQAIRHEPEKAIHHRNLGIVHYRSGRFEQALASYQEAARLEPEEASNHTTVAEALIALGRYDEALVAIRRARKRAGPGDGPRFPEFLANLEREAELGGRLPGAIDGSRPPATPEEAAGLAAVAYRRGLFVASARLYAGLMRDRPSSPDQRPGDDRYNAACSAALAGAGKGKDAAALSEEGRAEWRRRAIEWLRADLAAWAARPPEDRAVLRTTLAHWKEDADLAGVRDAGAAGAWTEEEQAAIRALWAEVDRVLAQAGS